MKPTSKYCLSVPPCCLNCLPLVRLILEVDVQLLGNEFINGYREGNMCHVLQSLINLHEQLHPYNSRELQ